MGLQLDDKEMMRQVPAMEDSLLRNESDILIQSMGMDKSKDATNQTIDTLNLNPSIVGEDGFGPGLDNIIGK